MFLSVADLPLPKEQAKTLSWKQHMLRDAYYQLEKKK